MQDATEVATEITVKRYQCRHIFTDGRRCGSPCLRHEPFCYYHHNTRRPATNTRSPKQAAFDIPLPEDRSAIQCTIGEVLRRIARNEIDPKRAGLLLYGPQIASLNIARATEPARDTALIEEITADPELGTLAPTAEITEPIKKKGFAQLMIEECEREQREERERKELDRAADEARVAARAAQPAILPLIQACHSRRPQRKHVILTRRRRHFSWCVILGAAKDLASRFCSSVILSRRRRTPATSAPPHRRKFLLTNPSQTPKQNDPPRKKQHRLTPRFASRQT